MLAICCFSYHLKKFLGAFKSLLKSSGGGNSPVARHGCGPEQLRVFQAVHGNALPKHATAYLRSDETVQCAAFERFTPHILHAIFNCPEKRRSH